MIKKIAEVNTSTFGYKFLCKEFTDCWQNQPLTRSVSTAKLFHTGRVRHVPSTATKERNRHANIQTPDRNASQPPFCHDDSNHRCTKGTFL